MLGTMIITAIPVSLMKLEIQRPVKVWKWMSPDRQRNSNNGKTENLRRMTLEMRYITCLRFVCGY